MLINGINIQPIQFILVFLAVLFIYLQIQFHYKIAPDDVDIYELTQELSKKQFDKVCDHDRVPFVFNFYETPDIMQYMNTIDYTTCSKTPIHIRAVAGTGSIAAPKFKCTTFINGMETLGNYAPHVSERNIELLKALHIPAFLKRRDLYLRPGMCQFIDYDLLFGSYMSATPLRYEINQRTFFTTVSGVATIRLIHPAIAAAEFRPNEEPQIDNVLMEYRSAANIWAPNTARRVQCIELTIYEGKTVFIPPFWWYSIQFPQPGATTRVLRFSYRNIINSIMLTPYLISHKLYAFSDLNDDDMNATSSHTKIQPVKEKDKKKKRVKIITPDTLMNLPPIPMQPQEPIPPQLPLLSQQEPMQPMQPPHQEPMQQPQQEPQQEAMPPSQQQQESMPMQSLQQQQEPIDPSQFIQTYQPMSSQAPQTELASPLVPSPPPPVPEEDTWTNKKHSNKFEQLMQQFNGADIDL